MRIDRRLPTALLLAAALAPGPARAAAPAPAPASESQPVKKGAVVTVDLSRVPTRQEVRGTATCAGSRMLATGQREEVLCQQPFTFDAPVVADPVVLLFQPSGGGRPTRLEYPLVRDPRPKTFTVPADGTLTRPAAAPPRPGEKPAVMPEALAQKARASASSTCDRCGGAGAYALKDLALKEETPPALEVIITIQPAP